MRSQIFDSPAYYRIAFVGELVGNMAELMEGMETEVTTSGNGRCTTVLRGWVPDQSALMGIVYMGYNLGLPLFSLERLEPTPKG